MECEQIGPHTLYRGDCREILPVLGEIDVVMTDPPWGINGGKGHINAQRGKGIYTTVFPDTPLYVETVVVPIIELCRKLARCSIVTPGAICLSSYPAADSFGCFYQPAAVGLQRFGNMDASPILYYGDSATGRNMGIACSAQVTEAPERNGHPCAKPLRAWTALLHRMTQTQQHILDPFMGSGTTGVACVQLGRIFTGIEIEQAYFDLACQRMHDALAQPDLCVPPPPRPTQPPLFVTGGA